MYIHLGTFFMSFPFFFHIINPFDFSVMFFLFAYLASEMFCFVCIQLFISNVIFTNLSVEIWKFLFSLLCLTLSRYLLSVLSFPDNFWLISTNYIVSLVCSSFSDVFIPLCPCVFFPRTFACSHSFFIWPSLISHPNFVVLYCLLRWIPILPPTNFARWWIRYLSSVIFTAVISSI